jgi:hypothetical protein
MGKKKNSEQKEEDEHEYAEIPPGWKEPPFTKEDNPHGRIYLNKIEEFYFEY